jgi:hypothetical protein
MKAFRLFRFRDPIRTPRCQSRWSPRAGTIVIGLSVSLGLAACGSGTKKTTSTSAASVPAASSSTTTQAATTTPRHTHKAATHKTTSKTKTTTSQSHTSTTSHSTTTSGSNNTSTTTSTNNPSPVTPALVGPLHATLTGQNHAPIVSRSWSYSVSARDGKGQPLSGTVEIEFVFNGSVVGKDTPPTHPITNGHWHDVLQFPPPSIGIPLMVQAVVHTKVGSTTLDWAVKVQR